MPDTIAGADALGITTEWRLTRNRFDGCQAASCPMVGACTSNPRHVACPFGAEPFEGLNNRHRTLTGHNSLTNAYLNKLADALAGVSNSLDVAALRWAVGTGATAITGATTVLPGEVLHPLLVDKTRPSTGKTTFYGFLTTTEGNGALTRFGLLSGDATATLGTGTLLNYWQQAITKTSADTLVMQYSITHAGA